MALAGAGLALLSSCSPRQDTKNPTPFGYHGAVNWVSIEDLPRSLAQFETVFWEPQDTPSLRKLMRETDVVKGKVGLEIGTGTGLLACCALQAGATRAVATDINPNAVLNARFNGTRLGFAKRLDVRQVTLAHPGAFEVIGDRECLIRGYSIRVIDDDRDPDTLPGEFLPGMLLEITVPNRRP